MNVNEMSCTEVNEAIAKLRDAHPELGGRPLPRDYFRSWSACGPLLEEMYAANHGLLWVRTATLSTPLTEATARAWLQWKMEAAS